jgi:hypothetical protein
MSQKSPRLETCPKLRHCSFLLLACRKDPWLLHSDFFDHIKGQACILARSIVEILAMMLHCLSPRWQGNGKDEAVVFVARLIAKVEATVNCVKIHRSKVKHLRLDYCKITSVPSNQGPTLDLLP